MPADHTIARHRACRFHGRFAFSFPVTPRPKLREAINDKKRKREESR